MNRERAKELLPIIHAFAEGKDIQYRTEWSNGWTNSSVPKFHDDREYRIKPEPREFTIVIYADDDKRAYNGWAPYFGVGGEEIIKVREVIDE